MPTHDMSTEARWLAEAWSTLSEYEGRWIAVVGSGVWGSDEDPEPLGRRARKDGHEPLLAFVWFERIA